MGMPAALNLTDQKSRKTREIEHVPIQSDRNMLETLMPLNSLFGGTSLLHTGVAATAVAYHGN